MLWQILICSIPHRHDKLCELLAFLDTQMMPGTGALLYLDNLELSIGEKRQLLLEASGADYVSFIDDDDTVASDFIPCVLSALASRPDYVGFLVSWLVDGVEQKPVQHSLRHRGWMELAEILLRDISHLNPVRRELALLGEFDSADDKSRYGEDHAWADQLRSTRLVRTEAWIGKPMYCYRYSNADSAETIRQPASRVRPPPRYPWLRSIGYFPTVTEWSSECPPLT